MEYVTTSPEQGLVNPDIAPGAAGTGVGVTARQLNAEHPHELQDLTHTLPDVDPTVTVILVVPWPAVIVQPAGTVQVYEDAPETADML